RRRQLELRRQRLGVFVLVLFLLCLLLRLDLRRRLSGFDRDIQCEYESHQQAHTAEARHCDPPWGIPRRELNARPLTGSITNIGHEGKEIGSENLLFPLSHNVARGGALGGKRSETKRKT